jgi:hypothetical protein
VGFDFLHRFEGKTLFEADIIDVKEGKSNTNAIYRFFL